MRKHCQWCKMQNLFLSVLLYWQVFYWMQSILLWSSVFIYFPPQISHNSYNLGLFAGFNNSLRTPVMCWEILLSRLRQFYQGFKSRLLLSWVNFFLTEWFYNAISWKSLLQQSESHILSKYVTPMIHTSDPLPLHE